MTLLEYSSMQNLTYNNLKKLTIARSFVLRPMSIRETVAEERVAVF